MKYSLIITISAALILLKSSNVFANQNQEVLKVELASEPAIVIEGKHLTISEAIKKALDLNPDIYIEKYNALMADTSKMKFDSMYSPIANLGVSKSSSEYPALLYSVKGKKVDSKTIETSIGKHFSSGTTIAAGFSHSQIDFEPGTVPQKFDITSPVAFVSLEQELLKNAFGFSEKRQRKILDNVTNAQKEGRVFSMSLITLGIVVDYWKLAIVNSHLDNSKLMLDETNKVRKITSKKVNSGLSEKFEINYWNSLSALSTTKVLQAQQDYSDTLRKFLRDINSNEQTKVLGTVVLSNKLPTINADDAVKIAMEKRFDYRNAKRELENAQLETELYKNNALPSLKGTLAASSMDYNSDSSSRAYDNLKNRQYPSYSVGLNLSFPLDDTGNKADLRNAKIKIKQAEKRLEATEKSVRDDVMSKVENIKTSYEVYLNAKMASLEAEEFYKKMLTHFENGRFNASSVRDAIDAMINAREAALQTLVMYNVSLLEFAVSKNELFESLNINIENYLSK